jgi:hypothetical protein
VNLKIIKYIHGKILIDDCRNLQDLLGALVCPISAELISYLAIRDILIAYCYVLLLCS